MQVMSTAQNKKMRSASISISRLVDPEELQMLMAALQRGYWIQPSNTLIKIQKVSWNGLAIGPESDGLPVNFATLVATIT